MQYLVEEAAAVALELHEANLHNQAADQAAGESDVRGRHKRLMQEAPAAV